MISIKNPSFGLKSFGHHIGKIEFLRSSLFGQFPGYYIDSNINFCINIGWAACNIMSLELKENLTLCRAKIKKKSVKFRTWKLLLAVILSYCTGFVYC